MRRGRSSLIVVSALSLACLTTFSAFAQSRNNSSPRRPAPEAAPSGHQTEAVDLNEGKSAAELFQAGCAVCHQSAAGLAKGRRDSELAGFLRQHYTSGTQHAAVLASYLAAAGGRGGPASASAPARVNPNAPIDRPPAPIGERKPAQEAARPQDSRESQPREPREPAAKRRPPEKPPVAARVAPPPAAPAAATEAAAHPGDAPAAAPSAPPPPPVEEKPAAPEIPL